MLKRIVSALALGTMLATSLIALVATPANAARADLSISALGWWWEDATREEREVPNVGTVTIETPNPFCPSAGSGTGSPKCSEGRLPIEVHRGDYETQNKISAVAFDMTLIPIGSKINKFTVTFREAKEGCYDKNGEPDNDPSDDVCEETSPFNVGEHELQACLVDTYFGDGEARPYKEAPNYTCTNGDPTAKRKEVESDKDGDGSNFYWTFDLTEYASKWTSKFSATTGIMIVGAPIKGEGNDNDQDTWRVVLTGPKFQNGVKAVIDYIPADDPVIPPPTTTDPTGGTTTTTTTTGTGGFGTTGTTGGVDTSGTGTVDTSGTGTEDGAAPGATPTPAFAFEEPQPVEELPGYIWLAILAGLVGFSLVRSIVMEKTTGVRPDGVLATIHALNEERGGAARTAATSAGPLAAVGAGVRAVGGKIGHAFGKLNFRKKG